MGLQDLQVMLDYLVHKVTQAHLDPQDLVEIQDHKVKLDFLDLRDLLVNVDLLDHLVL